jgi:signal transduction histidine kinase
VKPRLLIIYVLLVLAPLALLIWIGARVIRDDRARVQEQYRELITRRLQELRATIARATEERTRDLLRLTDVAQPDPGMLRELTRTQPHVRQFFVIHPDGKVAHPLPADASASERDFLLRAGALWRDRQAFLKSGEGDPPSGWYTWYWGDGLHVAFWQRHPAGHVVGAELDRARLLADVIALLPDTMPDGRLALTDATGAVLHQAGDTSADLPAITVPLSAPLASWRLEFHPRTPVAEPTGALVWVTVLAAFLALLVLAAYFYREHSRELREAAQRVSFVNQVSHELKTPLTNIRMYAELLQHAQPSRHLDVIVTESQRLSRLINNVLTFARPPKLHRVPGQIDDTIRAVLEDFRPALAAKGVAIRFTGNAPAPVSFDADALEQILGNLLSNVEKYAPGQPVTITTRQTDTATHITVADGGPGIPAADRERIFRPFYRRSDKLTDGVAGTGIGLTIARNLARQHGGDLRLVSGDGGARFELTLNSIS